MLVRLFFFLEGLGVHLSFDSMNEPDEYWYGNKQLFFLIFNNIDSIPKLLNFSSFFIHFVYIDSAADSMDFR